MNSVWNNRAERCQAFLMIKTLKKSTNLLNFTCTQYSVMEKGAHSVVCWNGEGTTEYLISKPIYLLKGFAFFLIYRLT